MSITFNVNRKAQQSLAHKPLSMTPVRAAIDGRTKSAVEASGANYVKVVGGLMDPAVADMYNDMDAASRTKYASQFKRATASAHGLMEAIHLSYADHYPLVLTPDSIWLTIAQGFGNHVNANAEKLRKRFVNHEGKKMILIERDHFVKGSPNNDWAGCFTEFSDRIEDHIGKKRQLITSEFSTTGAVEKAASELVLMDSMKSYFKYAVRTLCGIPSVSLTGTKEDWQKIVTKAENLAEFDLDWWVKPLIPVLNQFVKAAEGNPDVSFWDNMYKQEGGSGGPYCSGWCNVLFPYLEDYKGNPTKNGYAEKWDKGGWGGGPTMDAYPNSMCKVPFKWQVGMGTYDMEFLGGLVGTHQHEDLSIEPAIGWAVRDKGSYVEAPINPNDNW